MTVSSLCVIAQSFFLPGFFAAGFLADALGFAAFAAAFALGAGFAALAFFAAGLAAARFAFGARLSASAFFAFFLGGARCVTSPPDSSVPSAGSSITMASACRMSY